MAEISTLEMVRASKQVLNEYPKLLRRYEFADPKSVENFVRNIPDVVLVGVNNPRFDHDEEKLSSSIYSKRDNAVFLNIEVMLEVFSKLEEREGLTLTDLHIKANIFVNLIHELTHSYLEAVHRDLIGLKLSKHPVELSIFIDYKEEALVKTLTRLFIHAIEDSELRSAALMIDDIKHRATRNTAQGMPSIYSPLDDHAIGAIGIVLLRGLKYTMKDVRKAFQRSFGATSTPEEKNLVRKLSTLDADVKDRLMADL